MKVFKPFYYSVLAVLTAVILVFSCLTVSGLTQKTRIDLDDAKAHVKTLASAKSASVFDYTSSTAREYYIKDMLASNVQYGAFKQYQAGVDVNPTVDYLYSEASIPTGTAALNSVVSVRSAVSGEEQRRYYEERTGEEATEDYMTLYVKNIIAYMPASKNYPNSDVILINVSYDSSSLSADVSGLSSVAAALETIRAIANTNAFKNKEYKHDFMFVFSDASEQGNLGSYILRDRFVGFGKAYSRVKLALDFTSIGTDGAPVLYETTTSNSNLIYEWNKINKSIFTSSMFKPVSDLQTSSTRLSVYKNEFPSLSFATVADGEYKSTQLDSLKTITKDGKDTVQVSTKAISYFANAMLSSLEHFGAMEDLEALSAENDAVYFGYLGLFNVSYDYLVAYILGGFVLILVALVILLNINSRVFNFVQVAKGALIQLIALALSAAGGYTIYFILAGILTLFGVLNINSLASINISTIPLLISSGVMALCFAAMAYVVVKRLLLVKAADVVRANVFIWALAAAVISFAVPSISYIFVYTAILELVVLGLTIIFKQSFRDKFKMDMDRLFLYNIPIILTLPLIFPAYFFLAELLGLTWYPILTLFAVSMCGFIVPYFDYLKGVLDRFVKLLPSPSIIVVSEEIEKVEDKAKKGKFTEVKVKKTKRVKQTNSYKNRFGIAFSLIVSLILIIVFSLTGGSFSRNVSLSTLASDRLLVDDALIFVIDESDSTKATANNGTQLTKYWMVKDFDVYNTFSKAIYDFEWNDTVKAYVKQEIAPTTNNIATHYVPTASVESRDGSIVTFSVDTKIESMYYSLTFSGASNIKSVKLINAVNNDGSLHPSIEYDLTTNLARNENGDFVIKNLRKSLKVTIEAVSGVYSGKVTFNGAVSNFLSATPNDETILRNMSEWEALKDYYNDNADIYKNLKATMLIYKTFDL